MWAVGAILAELFTLCPIFPGESETDQLYKICCILGPPDWTIFPEVTSASRFVDISNSNVSPVDLSDVIPNASLEAIDLIKQLCSWDPLRRPTADKCLQHPFFHVGKSILEPLEDPLQLKLSNGGPKPNLELNLWDFGRQKDDYFLGLTLAINPSPPSLDLFPVEMTSRSRGTGTDMLLCSDFQGHSQESVFWSLLPPDHHQPSVPVESTLTSSFRNHPEAIVGERCEIRAKMEENKKNRFSTPQAASHASCGALGRMFNKPAPGPTWGAGMDAGDRIFVQICPGQGYFSPRPAQRV